jgi:hypothetical protein
VFCGFNNLIVTVYLPVLRRRVTFGGRKKVSDEAGFRVCEKKYRCAVEITYLTHKKSYESVFLGRYLISGPPER